MDITAVIEASGKTRKDICREAGISRGMLSFLETGKRKIGLNKIGSLSQALGVSPTLLRPDIYEKLDKAS